MPDRGPNKRPRVREAIPAGKRPVVTQATSEDDSLRVSWRFGDADRNGHWAWSRETMSPEDARDVLEFIHEMDKLTWAAASVGHRARAKRIDVSGICADAQRRLLDISRDDVEWLWEWHITGPKRIWGWRTGHVCHILWWDPEHTVWPTTR